MRAVLDASILVRAVVPDQLYHREVRSWLATVTEALAPTLLPFEVTTAIRHLECTRTIAGETADAALSAALRVRVTLRTPSGLHLRAFQLARELSVSRTRETAYLALALTEQCPLFTLDERFLRNCASRGYPVLHPVTAAI